MKKTILLLIGCFALSLCCFSQDCVIMFDSGMEYYKKGDYANALTRFNRVKEECGDGGNYRGVLALIKECQDKLNPQKPTVSPSKVSFDAQGGTQTVKVNCNSSWMYSNCPRWIKLTKNGQSKLTIECDVNDSGKERKADISIVVNEDNTLRTKIRVVQAYSMLSVSSSYVELPGNGVISNQIHVTCNEDWGIDVKMGNWYSAKKNSDGVLITCTENPSTERREGYFDIMTSNGASQRITVAQNGSNPRLTVERSLVVAWNAEHYILTVNSNMNWSAKVISGGSWCSAVKQNDNELLLTMSNNDLDATRTAVIRVMAGNINTDVTVTQRVYGYVSLYEDYFHNIGGTKRKTKVSVGAYAFGSYGLRASAFMYRWKVAEIDLLNLNMSYSNSFMLSWEPMIRGYLPLQRDGRFWTAYMGIGRCVRFYEGYPSNHSNVLFELGAESKLKWKGYEDLSARFFFRIDGTFSLGVAFDLYEWK